jgi:hypothetical protein
MARLALDLLATTLALEKLLVNLAFDVPGRSAVAVPGTGVVANRDASCFIL